jgi:AP-1 complex subunit sigma 1/2
VCELDIIFNFEKAYYMLDELLVGGELQETSKKHVLKAITAQDLLQEVQNSNGCHAAIVSRCAAGDGE